MGFFDFLFVPTVILLAVVAPVWILAHYVTKWRSAKTISGEDEKLLLELWESAERMEGRIGTLERILKSDDPDWKGER
ncbi:MAG: envelope stress response membrane protein PspB [Alphaproteobacteria bacterium]